MAQNRKENIPFQFDFIGKWKVRLTYSLGRVKFPIFFMAIPKNILYGPASPLSTKIWKLSIRNHLGHSLEVLGWPQLQYSLSKITSPNLTILFDCNFLVLLVDEEFMVCPLLYWKFWNLGEPLVTDLDYKEIHINETTREGQSGSWWV